jgi:hypothetical protein
MGRTVIIHKYTETYVQHDACDVTLSVHPHRASLKVCLTTVGIEPATFGIHKKHTVTYIRHIVDVREGGGRSKP